jgi:hypothetical protein
LTGSPDYQLGKRIAQFLNQNGSNNNPDSRLINSLPDLMGSDPSLLPPLRDMILRPRLRRLLHESQPSLLRSGCDSLIADLQFTYSSTIILRLQRVLSGILNLPDIDEPRTHRQWVDNPPPHSQDWPPSSHSVSAQPTPSTTVTYAIQTPSQGQSGLTAAMIALLALICGGGLVGLIWLLTGQSPPIRQGSPSTTQAPTTRSPAAPEPRQLQEPTPAPSNPWGPPEEYKFGQGPSQAYPDTCAFSKTDARGERTLEDKSQLEFWACRDEGGDTNTGYAVIWGDGKRTVYRFMNGGTGVVQGTNGQDVPMSWRNDTHNGQQIIAISHQDGANSWIPGHVDD